MPKVIPEYKEEARGRILEAAKKVFDEKGYRQATMDDVAKKIGVSKGALYLYFASKEDIFGAICRTEPLALKDILYSSFQDTTGPNMLENASLFFDKMVKRYGSSPGLNFEILSEASRNAELKRVLRTTHAEYAEIMVSFLLVLKEKGVIGRDVDLRSLADALIALYNGLEITLVSGLPVAEARSAWLEALKVMFMHPPTLHRY